MRAVPWLVVTLLCSAQAMAACREVADERERLACYDDWSGCAAVDDEADRLACFDRFRPGASASPAPMGGAEPRTAATADIESPADRVGERDPFPVHRSSPPRDQEQARLTARIVEIAQDRRGRRYLTLDNGQVWRELSEGRIELHPDMQVEIRRGVLGSINLSPADTEAYVKVRRIE